MRKQELQLKLALPTPVVSEHNRKDLPMRAEKSRLVLMAYQGSHPDHTMRRNR